MVFCLRNQTSRVRYELEDLWGHQQTVPKVKAVNSLTRVDNRHVPVRSALVHFTRNTSVCAAGQMREETAVKR